MSYGIQEGAGIKIGLLRLYNGSPAYLLTRDLGFLLAPKKYLFLSNMRSLGNLPCITSNEAPELRHVILVKRAVGFDDEVQTLLHIYVNLYPSCSLNALSFINQNPYSNI
jgi:hypothetical protein